MSQTAVAPDHTHDDWLTFNSDYDKAKKKSKSNKIRSTKIAKIFGRKKIFFAIKKIIVSMKNKNTFSSIRL